MGSFEDYKDWIGKPRPPWYIPTMYDSPEEQKTYDINALSWYRDEEKRYPGTYRDEIRQLEYQLGIIPKKKRDQ